MILSQDHDGARPTEILVTEIMKTDWGLDRLGLGKTDHAYLQLIAAASTPVGLSNLASQMAVEPAQLELEIEPFLVFLNLVERTAKGRLLTSEGRQLVQHLALSHDAASSERRSRRRLEPGDIRQGRCRHRLDPSPVHGG